MSKEFILRERYGFIWNFNRLMMEYSRKKIVIVTWVKRRKESLCYKSNTVAMRVPNFDKVFHTNVGIIALSEIFRNR